ncbi:MAG: hypothetical protein JXA18_14080 [Chitinispirillaceae bacterium]|nr:hypothetical protein [Chitinispirillaceae bacterium]
MIRIFLDANILFSAAMKGSATRILFDAATIHADGCLTSPHAVEEARRNLAMKRPGLLPDFSELYRQVTVSNAFFHGLETDLPSQDIPILAGAIGAGCTHLWTGDKRHFGRFYGKTLQCVRIVSGILLADLLFAAGWKYRTGQR